MFDIIFRFFPIQTANFGGSVCTLPMWRKKSWLLEATPWKQIYSVGTSCWVSRSYLSQTNFPISWPFCKSNQEKSSTKMHFPPKLSWSHQKLICYGARVRENVRENSHHLWPANDSWIYLGILFQLRKFFKSKHYRGTSKNSFKHSSCFYLAICWFLRLQGWPWNKKLLSSRHCKNTAKCITPAVTWVKGLFVIWELPYFGR